MKNARFLFKNIVMHPIMKTSAPIPFRDNDSVVEKTAKKFRINHSTSEIALGGKGMNAPFQKLTSQAA